MTPRSTDKEELPEASDRARKLVANHETVAREYRHWGATELGDAEAAVLEYIASLESENERLKETALTPKQAWAIFGLGIKPEHGSYSSAYSGDDYTKALGALRHAAGEVQPKAEEPMHLCGARGFGQSLNDSCPACDVASSTGKEMDE